MSDVSPVIAGGELGTLICMSNIKCMVCVGDSNGLRRQLLVSPTNPRGYTEFSGIVSTGNSLRNWPTSSCNA